MSSRNYILDTISPEDRERLAPHLEPVALPFRFILEMPKRPIEHVYFPDEGLISVVTHGGSGQEIEVGVIGFDGCSGSAVLLGAERSPHSVHIQIAGRGQRIAAGPLLQIVAQSPPLRSILLRYIQGFMVQAAQTALANGRGKLDTRLARWLLMAHDRIESSTLGLTHEYLSLMLGVRRPGVTVALQKLEMMGLVATGRSSITIKDRAGLETVADGIYGIAEAEQERLTGWRRLHR